MNLLIGHLSQYFLNQRKKTMNQIEHNTVASINTWHALARPNPDDQAFQVQLGCHYEEIAEQLAELIGNDDEFESDLQKAYSAVINVATKLKNHVATTSIINRKRFLDSVADQVVTGIGVAHCAKMDAVTAIDRVDRSNWSKFVDGKPVFNEKGKIAKPATYREPDLEGCY